MIPSTMTAIAITAPGGPDVLVAQTRPIPEPKPNEVLIRVRRAGVCGTDVHIYEWDDWARGRCKPPFVVGHEFALCSLLTAIFLWI